jgi:hypothetical protein
VQSVLESSFKFIDSFHETHLAESGTNIQSIDLFLIFFMG